MFVRSVYKACRSAIHLVTVQQRVIAITSVRDRSLHWKRGPPLGSRHVIRWPAQSQPAAVSRARHRSSRMFRPVSAVGSRARARQQSSATIELHAATSRLLAARAAGDCAGLRRELEGWTFLTPVAEFWKDLHRAEAKQRLREAVARNDWASVRAEVTDDAACGQSPASVEIFSFE